MLHFFMEPFSHDKCDCGWRTYLDILPFGSSNESFFSFSISEIWRKGLCCCMQDQASMTFLISFCLLCYPSASCLLCLYWYIWYDMIYLPVFCPFWPYLFASSYMCSLCYWSMCKLKEKEKEKRKGRGVQFCVYRELHNINITQSFMYAHFYAVIIEAFRSHLILMHLLNVPACIVLWGFDLISIYQSFKYVMCDEFILIVQSFADNFRKLENI